MNDAKDRDTIRKCLEKECQGASNQLARFVRHNGSINSTYDSSFREHDIDLVKPASESSTLNDSTSGVCVVACLAVARGPGYCHVSTNTTETYSFDDEDEFLIAMKECRVIIAESFTCRFQLNPLLFVFAKYITRFDRNK